MFVLRCCAVLRQTILFSGQLIYCYCSCFEISSQTVELFLLLMGKKFLPHRDQWSYFYIRPVRWSDLDAGDLVNDFRSLGLSLGFQVTALANLGLKGGFYSPILWPWRISVFLIRLLNFKRVGQPTVFTWFLLVKTRSEYVGCKSVPRSRDFISPYECRVLHKSFNVVENKLEWLTCLKTTLEGLIYRESTHGSTRNSEISSPSITRLLDLKSTTITRYWNKSIPYINRY